MDALGFACFTKVVVFATSTLVTNSLDSVGRALTTRVASIADCVVFVRTSLFLRDRSLENVSSNLLDFRENLLEVVNHVFEVFVLLKR